MSGTLKVGGVNLATHTGTDGLVTGMSWGSSVPSGSVLQIRADTYNRTSNMTIATSDDERKIGADLEVKITCSSPDNKLLVMCYLPNWFNDGTSNVYMKAGFRYSVTDSDYADNWGSSDLNLGLVWVNTYIGYQTAGGNEMDTVYLQMWVSVPTVLPMNIQVATKAITGSQIIFNGADATQQEASLVIQEVKGYP